MLDYTFGWSEYDAAFVPLIPGYNDMDDNILAIVEFVSSLDITRIAFRLIIKWQDLNYLAGEKICARRDYTTNIKRFGPYPGDCHQAWS